MDNLLSPTRYADVFYCLVWCALIYLYLREIPRIVFSPPPPTSTTATNPTNIWFQLLKLQADNMERGSSKRFRYSQVAYDFSYEIYFTGGMAHLHFFLLFSHLFFRVGCA